MNAISILKNACSGKPFKSFKNLSHGDYLVNNFQRVNTTYGDRLRVELDDCIMYLPERFTSYITDTHLTDLSTATVIMSYSGKDPNSQNRLLLDFEIIGVDEDGELTSANIGGIQTREQTQDLNPTK